MTEEEYFRKNYPDYCYGDKPLSPYWDFFQDGVEFVESQSKKKIEELESQNKLLGARCNQLLADKGDLTDRLDQAYTLLKECAKYVKAIRNYNIYFSTKESSDKPDALLADVEKFLKGVDNDSLESI